jgi:hypothetical protein
MHTAVVATIMIARPLPWTLLTARLARQTATNELAWCNVAVYLECLALVWQRMPKRANPNSTSFTPSHVGWNRHFCYDKVLQVAQVHIFELVCELEVYGIKHNMNIVVKIGLQHIVG